MLVDDELYTADGYGSNYISRANVKSQQWTEIFGGKTDNPQENGKFASARGINLNQVHQHLHNVVLFARNDPLYLICQAWNPGRYFVPQMV